MTSALPSQSMSTRRRTTTGGSDYWSVCTRATPDAVISQLPHGTLIHTSCFTSLVAQPHHHLHGTERIQYEVHLLSGGHLQVGWCAPLAEASFNENDGVGDLPLSAAVDGSRGMLWSVDARAIPSLRWAPGDVVGCYADLGSGEMEFTLNGTHMARISLPTSSTVAARASSADAAESRTRRSTTLRETLVYLPAVSLGASEACVANTGETSLRYPRKGYWTLCEHDSFAAFQAKHRDASQSAPPLLVPVPLGTSNMRSLILDLGFAAEKLSISGVAGNEVHPTTLTSCSDSAVEFLASVLNDCAGDVFDAVLPLVQWLQADVTARWHAFVLTLYLWVSRLYVGNDDQSESARRLVTVSNPVRQRIQRAFDLLEMLLPTDEFAAIPSVLLAVFQHRLADRSGARKLAVRVTCDLVHVPSFRRHWVRDGAMFTSTLLNLFQLFPISASESKWLTQQLQKHTIEHIVLSSSTTPSSLSKNQLEYQASAFQCVEVLFSDAECHAPLTLALSALTRDLSLTRDDISCTLEARLGGYRPTLPLTFAMPSPAAVVGSLSWAVAAALGKEMDADAALAMPRTCQEPYSLDGLDFRAVALKWLPPRTFYAARGQPSRDTPRAAGAVRPDVRVGGSAASVQAQLEVEAAKPVHTRVLSTSTLPTSTASRRLNTSCHASTTQPYDGDSENECDDDEGVLDSDDDEGPALGSAAVSRRARPSMSTVRRQRTTPSPASATTSASGASHVHTTPTSATAPRPRWDERAWRHQSAQFAADRASYAQAAAGKASVRDAASTAPATSSTRPPHGEEAGRTDLFHTAVTFFYTFTRHPISLFGSLEILLNLAEQYTLVRAGTGTSYTPVRQPSSDKSADSADESAHASVVAPHRSAAASTTRRAAAATRPSASSLADSSADRDAAGTGNGAFALGQSAEDALRELCTMLRRVEMSRYWSATTANLSRFVTGTWTILAYYWSRMNLFERRLFADPSLPTSASLAARDEAESKHCPPRAFLMLPVELLELCAEVPVYASALEKAETSVTPRSTAVVLLSWDAQLRRAVSHSTARSLLYRATASLFGSSTGARQTVTQALQDQKQAHEAYLERVEPLQRPLEDPFSLYEATFLDGLEAYTSEENFNEASTLNLLFSLRQDSCLLPPPRLFEENFWWVNALRSGTVTSEESKMRETRDRQAGMEADALTLHAAVSAVLKSDTIVESTLASISKCNQLLTQFSELLPVTPASMRHTDDVKSFQVKYVLLRKSLYVLDFLVKVLSTAEHSLAQPHRPASSTPRHLPDAIRVSLMDLLTQCVVRLAFLTPDGRGGGAPESHDHSTASRASMRSYWSFTTNALTESVSVPSARNSSVPSSIGVSTISSNVLQPALCRDADGWWSCAGSACTVTGLLAPVFSLLFHVVSTHGTDVSTNPFFQAATSSDVLVRRSLELLGHQSWWSRQSPAGPEWCRDELLPERSQTVLVALQKNLHDVEKSLRYARAGIKMTPTPTTAASSKTRTVALTSSSSQHAQDTAGSGEVCLICQEALADTRFNPCGHVCCHLCFSRYQNTLTVRAASSARRSAPSSRPRDGNSNAREEQPSGVADDECLTLSWFSSSRRSREETTTYPEKCFFCQQNIEGVRQLTPA